MPAREVLLDDVVLRRAGQLLADRLGLGAVGRVDAGLLERGHLVEREQPHRRGVDRHRRVHLGERDVVEQRAHVAEVADRHADLADLAARQLVVGVVAGLGRQVEGDGQPGLALGEVAPVERVGLGRRGVAGVGAHQPGLVRTCGRLRLEPAVARSLLASNLAVAAAGAVRLRAGSSGEDAVQPGNRRMRTRRGLASRSTRRRPALLGPAVGAEQDPEPGRVDQVDAGDVDDQVAVARVDGASAARRAPRSRCWRPGARTARARSPRQR